MAMLWALAVTVAPVLALVLTALLRPLAKVESAARLRIAFVHPDLGIGGAERLVVDAAVALQKAGHEVLMYTARHERSHCFEETRDGTLDVTVYGAFLPRRVLGRFYAACAYLRMCWVSLRIVLIAMSSPFNVIIVDQVSICLPILLLARPAGIIFYCHYPDKLLTGRESLLKKLYRVPLDWMEEQTTGLANVIFVNSKFTAGVFAGAFASLHARGVRPDVLYPALNLEDQDKQAALAASSLAELQEGELMLLSINRFERKKNVGLAVRALAALKEADRRRVRLVVAGGYDDRLPENVEHAAELDELAKELGVSERVVQMRSVPASTKATLLRHCACLLYTPDREHFGIVPVEAMYSRVPVLAVNSGGPLESIVEGETGYHRPQEPEAWAEVITKLLHDEALRNQLGEAGRKRAADKFSLAAFGDALNNTVVGLAQATSEGSRKEK